MTQTVIDLIELAYRLKEEDLADLTQDQLKQFATAPSIINALCSYEVARRQRQGLDVDWFSPTRIGGETAAVTSQSPTPPQSIAEVSCSMPTAINKGVNL